MNRYAELEPLDEESLRRVRRILSSEGYQTYCPYCSASARTFHNNIIPTVEFRCGTMLQARRLLWKRTDMCRRIAEEDNKVEG